MSIRQTWLAALSLTLLAGCSTDDGTSDPEDTTTPEPGQAQTKIYVADEEGGSVSVIDHTTNSRITTIDLTDGLLRYEPHNVQVAPDGASVWVVAPPAAEDAHGHEPSDDTEQVIVIDPSTDTIEARIALGSGLHLAHVVLDSDSRYAYVTANEADTVFQIDADSFEVVREYALVEGSTPHGLRYCGGKLYVADMGSLGMSIIDTASGDIQDVPLGGVTVQTACTPDGQYVFASLYDTIEVVRYDVATGELTRIALPEGAQGPIQLYSSPDSTRLYVADQGMLMDRPASNQLFEIDVEAASVSATIQVGEGAHGVVVNEDGTRAYVTNTAEDTVSVVDTAQRTVVATVQVGAAPNGVSHLHIGGGMP